MHPTSAADMVIVNQGLSLSGTQIINAIAAAGGNKSRAAQMLGLTLRQLNYRLTKMSAAV